MGTSSWQDRRVWLAGGGLLAVIVIAASWLLMIDPKLSGATNLRSEAANTTSQNALLVAKNDQLAAQERGIGRLRSNLANQLRALPPTAALTSFIDQLTTVAAGESVTITNTTVSAPIPIAAPIAVTPSATTDGTAASPTTSPTPSPTASSTEAAAAAMTPTVASQYSINVSVATNGTLPHQVAFLRALQHGSRPLLIASVQVARTGSSASRQTTLNIQFAIFTAPMSAAQVTALTRLVHGVK